MADMLSTTVEGLQRLKTKVRDYEGYGETVKRRHSDKTIRMYLSGKIDEILKQLNADCKSSDAKDQDRLDTFISRTKRTLDTIHSSLTSPTYIHEPFFQSASIPAQRCTRIYDLEQYMLDDIENIRVELSELYKNGDERGLIQEHFLRIDTFVDNINQALFEREALILGDV